MHIILCVGVFTHMDVSDHQESVPTENVSRTRKILTAWNLRKNGLLGIIKVLQKDVYSSISIKKYIMFSYIKVVQKPLLFCSFKFHAYCRKKAFILFDVITNTLVNAVSGNLYNKLKRIIPLPCLWFHLSTERLSRKNYNSEGWKWTISWFQKPN